MADYLPEEVTVPDHGLDRSSPEVAELIASLAVIGLPQGYESVRRAS
jgi:hypothetical protein